jgi:peptide deformylase
MLLKLYQSGQPILRQIATKVSPQELQRDHVQGVIDFMIETLRDAPGVGLAAPQIGESLQIIIVEDLEKYHDIVPPDLLSEQGRQPVELTVLINPVLEVIDVDPALYFEGCLSIDGYCAAVQRAKVVKVSALDRTGKSITYTAHNWQARILQHEVDHLKGMLYIDRMETRSFMSLKYFGLEWRKRYTAEISSAFIS